MCNGECWCVMENVGGDVGVMKMIGMEDDWFKWGMLVRMLVCNGEFW